MQFPKIVRRNAWKTLPVAVSAAALTLSAGTANAVPAHSDPMPTSFDFSDCPALPAGTLNGLCINLVVTSGSVQVGNVDYSISSPVAFTWNNYYDRILRKQVYSFGGIDAADVQLPSSVFGGSVTGPVYARLEYAGGIGMPNGGSGSVDIGLKVKLINPALGDDCYIGSDGSPISLHMTTGTTNPPPPNTPISGSLPVSVTSPDPSYGVYSITEVDNAFAVDGASGCGTGGALDTAVNQAVGLPSAAGRNTVIANGYAAHISYSALGS
ncbi:hypothetical protein [Actinomadura atramentaria]|uniref:hypothetical protein n=1 Tax=Actinomadura atramentaria TaxID=1990 RepID=UPI0003744B59|nr:hypothetical protein [Actinomadura atramentaria]